jgi:hypothetical protein
MADELPTFAVIESVVYIVARTSQIAKAWRKAKLSGILSREPICFSLDAVINSCGLIGVRYRLIVLVGLKPEDLEDAQVRLRYNLVICVDPV